MTGAIRRLFWNVCGRWVHRPNKNREPLREALHSLPCRPQYPCWDFKSHICAFYGHVTVNFIRRVLGQLSPDRRQFTRNRATYVSEALVPAVQGEQRVLRTEAAVHVPDRIMRQSASRIAHERFRLNYQIPPALACRRSNVDAA